MQNRQACGQVSGSRNPDAITFLKGRDWTAFHIRDFGDRVDNDFMPGKGGT